jgi:hypothetical protein
MGPSQRPRFSRKETMLGLIESIIQLGSGIVTYLNMKDAEHYIHKMTDLKLEILKEENKGDLANDCKIMDLQAQLKIILDSLTQQVVSRMSTK